MVTTSSLPSQRGADRTWIRGGSRAAGLGALLVAMAWAWGVPPVPAGAASWTPPGSGCGRWRIVPTPIPPEGVGSLLGVSGTSFRDVWAVGGYGFYPAPPIILHWDGTGWSPFGFQTVHSRNLFDVVAISPTDAWAVGKATLPASDQALAMHWDGMSWRMVPTVPENYAYLNSVDAVASDDVWAVGQISDPDDRSFILHWDGTSWRRVPAPDPSPGIDDLYAVSAAGPDDVWAVGTQQAPGLQFKPLIEHWDGTRWSVVPPATGTGIDDWLYGVAAVSASDVWAVGARGGEAGIHALLQHWDGTSWSLVPDPDPDRSTQLWDVSAASSADVWAAGRLGFASTLTEHWDGTAWEVVPTPSPGDSTYLDAIDAVSATDVWNVGTADSLPLAEHSLGCA